MKRKTESVIATGHELSVKVSPKNRTGTNATSMSII